MKNSQIILNSIIVTFLSIAILHFSPVDATKTGGYNFCTAYPAFPECAGWRSETLRDNYWFCEFVYLKNLCEKQPSPEKEIPLRTQDYCCKYIGPELDKEKILIPNQNLVEKQIVPTDTQESILPLIIWTDKDHYNYLEKVIVYGKFDFTNPSIKKNIFETNFDQTGEIIEKDFTIDIKLNGDTVLRKVPVTENGWFSSFFFLNNSYKFSTQDNLLEVEYIITSGYISPDGPKTHATYHFTTGEIAKNESGFEFWIDDNLLPHKIQFGVTVENNEKFIELMRQNLIKTRLITPDGYIIPINAVFTPNDLSGEFDGFRNYGEGTYQIQVTYGNNTVKKIFEYSN